MKFLFAFFLLMFVVLIAFTPSAAAQEAAPEGLDIGDEAPEFEAESAEGDLWKSEEHTGQNLLVVYFYPAAMTGGCTAQACSFRDNRSRLTDLGAEVVGISGDSIENLKIFKKSNNLNFPLLSDPEGKAAQAFGVPVGDGGTITREVDGEEVELTRTVTTSRWTFIIGRDGTILYKDTEVDAAGDSEAVITAIRDLAMNE